MRLKDNLISALINILLGVAWASVFVSAASAFFTHYKQSILYAIANSIIWMIPGLFAILILEYILSGFARLEEARKQTKLLEELLKREESKKEENNN